MEWMWRVARHLKPIFDWEDRAEKAKYNWTALKAGTGGNAEQLGRQAYEKFHMSALQWLRKARLVKSKELLLQNKFPKEVSNEVGYSKVQNFTLFFKKATGLTPVEFVRRSSAKKPT